MGVSQIHVSVLGFSFLFIILLVQLEAEKLLIR